MICPSNSYSFTYFAIPSVLTLEIFSIDYRTHSGVNCGNPLMYYNQSAETEHETIKPPRLEHSTKPLTCILLC